MDDVTRRRAIKLAAASGVVATGVIGAGTEAEAADDQKAGGGDKKRETKEVHKILEQLQRDAVLVSAIASFHTNNDDKDWDTKLSIYVKKRDNSDVAKIENIMGLFPDNSNNGPFALALLSAIPRAEVANCHTDVVIAPNGHDTWRFNYYLRLVFSDSTHVDYGWNGLVLDQDVRTTTKVL